MSVIELAAGEGTAALRALSVPFPSSAGFVYQRCPAVLAGTAGGRILTDDPERPTWAAVQEFSGDGVLFLSGALDPELVGRLIERLRRDHVVTVGLSGEDPLRRLLPAARSVERRDIVFQERDLNVDLREPSREPAGLQLMPIDEELLARCLWEPWLSADGAAALANGLGYCLLDGATVVAEAFAGPLVAGELEMATITRAGYRRRGLASVVCARTVLECERRGYRTWWNADAMNAGSVALARRLGYRTEHSFHVLAWQRG